MSLIKWSINFHDLNFHYFGYKSDILDTNERGVFYQRGDLDLITVKLQSTLQSDQISSLDPFIRLGKVP